MCLHQDNRVARWVRTAVCCLTLTTIAACGSPPPAPATSLTVRSNPEAAHIMINGTVYGQTPITISDLAAGEHYIILKKEDYRRSTQRIRLELDTPVELDFDLVRDAGYVTFTTTPDGAEVYLHTSEGSRLIGETPLENAQLDTGDYSFEILLENYHPTQSDIVVEHGNYYTEKHALKAMVARLRILSRPTGAQVWIDDELRPETTPANINLPPGAYSVGVYKQGYMMNEQTIELAANSSFDLNAVLEEGDMPFGMVLIPAGEFIFGDDDKSPDEKPVRKVHLEAFYMDKNEVTNAEFKKVFPGHTFDGHRDNYPVRGVSWKRAADFAAAVGKRLPTEKEWEKAARGASGREYPWGAVFNIDHAHIATGLNSDSQSVGSYKTGVSEYGCFDMSGNVYEWTSDWYNPYPGNTEVTVDYGTVYKVIRGGSYRSDAFELRSAKRHYDKPDARREDYGFRCAKNFDQ